MEFLIFFAFLFLILLPVVLSTTISVYKNHYKATGNVVNYDSSMRKYVYKVYMAKEEIINTLRNNNGIDEISCNLDFERSIINFSEYGSNRDYYFQIQECDGFSILRLKQVSLLCMSSRIPYKLNPFIVRKLQAEIIPFSQYEF